MMPGASQVLALTALLALGGGVASAQTPRLAEVEGTVEIGTGDPPQWRAAGSGDTLQPGEALRLGAGARAELELSKGTIRLYENSLLRLPSDGLGGSGERAVELERGGSLFDIDAEANREGFEVRTPEAVVTVKGTRFSVALEAGAAAVAVFRGVVGVRSLIETFEHEVLVRQGFTAVGGIDRPFELHFERLPDPWPHWKSPLPQALPRPEVRRPEPPPAAISTEQAREAGRKEIRPEVLERALEEKSGVRDRVRQKLIEKRLQQRDAEKLPAPDALGPGAPVSSELDKELIESRATLPRDPAYQSPDDDEERVLEDQLAEKVLNVAGMGPAPAAAAALAPASFSPLEIELIRSASPNFLSFLDTSRSQVATMTEAEIDQYLLTRNPALIPTPVMNNITAGGLDPVDYMRMLDDVYF